MNSADNTRPLVIDLDGTLLKVDSLDEALRWLFLHQPFRLMQLLVAKLWVKRAPWKWALYTGVELGPVPFNQELVVWLRAQKAEGRKLILCSGTPQFYVEKMGARLEGLFDEYVGSLEHINRKGRRKAEYLVERFGEQGFDYVGNSSADIKVWAHAKGGYNVNNASDFLAKVARKKITPPTLIAAHTQDRVWDYLKAMRLSHWAKNVLIVVPLVAAHEFGTLSAWGDLGLLFVALGLLASAGYLINDFWDLEADRVTPEKAVRPMASGALSVVAGWNFGLALFVIGLGLGFSISLTAGLGVLLYFLASFIYTLRLKTIVGLDIILLAGLYVYRMVLGGWASGVTVSPWLIVAAFFFFIQLAAVKRAGELRTKGEGPRRPYRLIHQNAIESLSMASACLAPLVVAIYAAQPNVARLYTHPAWLVVSVPLLLYWGLNCHFKMLEGKTTDPLKYALCEKSNYVLALAVLVVFLLSK